MRKIALAIVILGSSAAWGQSPSAASSAAVKVDRAAAYYHFVLAHMYSEMADATTNKRIVIECESKVIENYKAAVKADPNTPNPRDLASPFSQIYIPQAPASRQERSRP
jgi:hypothetical protein